jgi:aryl-alcohol dehydrogenase-like predicted oxidoreductase
VHLPREALSYAMSLPVATTISGIDSMEVLDQNLAILRDFQSISTEQMQTLRNNVSNSRTEGRQRSWPQPARLSLKR